MEEIDLKELLVFFKNKIGLLLGITIIVCLMGCVYGLLLQVPKYKSYTSVILNGMDTTITQNDITINKNLVDTYAEIVKSRRVLSQVINELNLDVSYERLSETISVSAINETEIIKIIVINEDPVLAKNIANVTANYFIKEVIDLYKINNVNILDEAISAENPYNVNLIKQIIIYVLVGLVLGFGLLFIIYYFDRTIKSVEQIEQKIKLPILGTVQLYSKGGK